MESDDNHTFENDEIGITPQTEEYINDNVEICLRRIPFYTNTKSDFWIYIYWKKTNKTEKFNNDDVFVTLAKDNVTSIYSINRKIFVNSRSNQYILSFNGEKLDRLPISDWFKKKIEKNIKKEVNNSFNYSMIMR